jgi:hypothetical protein
VQTRRTDLVHPHYLYRRVATSLTPRTGDPRSGPAAGHGGQVGFADPVSGLGVGFVRSHLSLSPHFAAALMDATYACL